MCKYYLVKDTELRQLVTDSNKLLAFEAGGVDNWSGYWESLREYQKTYGKGCSVSIEDLDKLYESTKK